MQTVQTQINDGAVWSKSSLFAFLLSILRDKFIESKIQAKKYGIKC